MAEPNPNNAVALSPRNSLPILKLPTVAVEVLLARFKPNDLFTLGMSSSAALKLLQDISTTHKAELCVVTLWSNVFEMEMTSSQWKEGFYWTVEPLWCRPPRVDCEQRRIGNHDMVVQNLGDHCHAYCLDRHKAFVALTNLGLEVFYVPIKLIVKAGLTDIRTILSAPHFRRIDELIIEEDTFPDDELQEVLDCLQVIKKIRIPGSANVYVPQAFEAKEVFMSNGEWLRPTDLLKFTECEKLELGEHRIPWKDVEEFVKHWLTRTDKPPQKRFVFEWDTEDFEQLTGIETFKWDKTKRAKSCWMDEENGEVYDMSLAMDIERPDGLLASLHCCETFARTELVFHVWHERFPTAAAIAIAQQRVDEGYRTLPSVAANYGIGLPEEYEVLNRNISTERFHELIARANLTRLRADLNDDNLPEWYNRHYALLCARQNLDDLI